MILLLLIAVLLAGLSVALAIRAAAATRVRNNAILAQIDAYGFHGVSQFAERLHLQEALARLATWMGARLARRVGEARVRKIRTLLNGAGFYRITVTRYLGYWGLTSIGLPVAILLLAILGGSTGPKTLLAVLLMALLGWRLPPAYLERRRRIRAQKIDYEVPELVDLLVATVEAGVGFVAALQLAAQRVREPLREELRLTLREQAMGLTIADALRHLADRGTSQNLRLFVQAILQGETLGVSIGKTLRDLAVDMRKRRRQLAEERAQKAPIKIVFPLAALILPAMFVVIIGPALYAIGHSLG